MSFELKDYVDVRQRVELFVQQWPTGSIQFDFKGLMPGRDDMIWGIATVWRTPDEVHPTTGVAAELINGKTGFTRNSELMNLETSAIGRALGMLGIGIKKSLASRDEVSLSEARNKGANPDQPGMPIDPWAAIDEPVEIRDVESGNITMKFCDHGEMNRYNGIDKNGKKYTAHNCRQKVCETQWQRY